MNGWREIHVHPSIRVLSVWVHTHIDTCVHIYIYVHVHACVYTGYSLGVEGSTRGCSQFFQRSKHPGARRHVSVQRSVVVETAARARPSQGPSGRARAARHVAAWTHILVIHGAHRTSPSAAGMVPRRPTAESTIEQPLLGDVHCSEQLHVRVPFAHLLLVPSHSNDTLSAIPSKSARCNECMHVYIFACVRAGVEYSSEHSKGPSTRRNHIDRALTRSSKHA
jgi:hypothetical protein